MCVIKRFEDNQKPQIKEGQIMQWPKEKEQRDKQWCTKYYTESNKSSDSNPTTTRDEYRFCQRV